jgi:NTP pyrophosphatase (non-canonical NTP hydrolase)
MNRLEHLLTIVMEECDEVSQRVSKAKRFGMEQVQQNVDDRPEQNPDLLTNRQRILEEYYDLRAVLGMAGIDAWENSDRTRSIEQAKVGKVLRYLEFARACGTLQDSGRPIMGVRE